MRNEISDRIDKDSEGRIKGAGGTQCWTREKYISFNELGGKDLGWNKLIVRR